MSDISKLNTVLSDADPEHTSSLPVRVVSNGSALSIFPQGYGDFASAEGNGCPVFLELFQGRLRLIVFADIEQEDPTHVIDLEMAREDQAIGIRKSLSPLEEGRRYFDMLSKVNLRTGHRYTMKEVAVVYGVEQRRVRRLVSLWQPMQRPKR